VNEISDEGAFGIIVPLAGQGAEAKRGVRLVLILGYPTAGPCATGAYRSYSAQFPQLKNRYKCNNPQNK